jgi:TRAP-type C4-dicarboxylate transport system substrate-binding protein
LTALAVVVVGCSGSHAAQRPAASVHYSDPAGDGVPDIRGVDVSTTGSRISFRVRVDKLPPSGTVFDFWLDTDADPDTGNTTFAGADGADYMFSAFLGLEPPGDCSPIRTRNGCLVRYAPGGWAGAPATTAAVSRTATGFTASIDRSDLGNTRELNFHVNRGDLERAPGSGTYNYSLALGGPKPEVAAGGNEPANKAGAPARPGPTTLKLATHDYTDAWAEGFADAVKHFTGGSVRIDIKYGWRFYDPDFEGRTISDVRHGDFDLASVGARAWDTAGAKSFGALVAPFLVDSTALQGRVLESPLAQRMLDGVRPLGLVGLAVLPGELRRPLGVSHALTRPRDFRGDKIGIRLGGVAKETFRALGATATAFPTTPEGLAHVDGAEVGLPTIVSNRYDLRARALTSNVVLWPRATTIVMNAKAFDALSADQQDALRRAGREEVGPILASFERYESDSLAAVCRAGRLPLVAASPADRAALRRAVQPVYDELTRDASTREMISEIRSMRAGLPPPEALRCAAASAAAGHSALGGRWQVDLTAADLRAIGLSPDEIQNYRGAWTLAFGHGRWDAERQTPPSFFKGTYAVKGQTLQEVVDSCGQNTHCTPGDTSYYRFSVYRDQLTFSRIPGRYGSPELVAKAWTRER